MTRPIAVAMLALYLVGAVVAVMVCVQAVQGIVGWLA